MARYEWPPLPITDPEEASRRMSAAMRSAWDDLEAERLRVFESKTMTRKALVDAWLKEFQAAIDVFGDDVAHHLDRFAQLHLAPHYMAGVRSAGGVPVFTAIHRQAFAALATDTYNDFLGRSQKAKKTARAFAVAVRAAAAEELPKVSAGGRTVLQAAERFEARLLSQYGITTVVYRDGTRVPVDVYTRMAARTKSAVAYNAGTLNETVASGTKYVEVFDGFDCGWETHTSTDKANGTIRTVEDAAAHAVSHPNCTRAFGPRPDLKTHEQAGKAGPSTTADQRLDQAEIDWSPGRQAMRDRARQQQRVRIAQRREDRVFRLTDGRGVTPIENIARSVHRQAAKVEPRIKADIVQVAAELGVRMERLGSSLKDQGSIARKVYGDAAEKGVTTTQAAAGLSDTVRFTAVASEEAYWAMGNDMMARLVEQGYRVVKDPAGWNRVGYKGRNTKLVSPTGQTFEVQVHTDASLDAAERSHALLDLQREATSPEEFLDFQRQMDDIMDSVPVPPDTVWL